MSILDAFKKKTPGLKQEVIPQIDSFAGDGINHRSSALLMNDGVNICAKACASCWDAKLPESYADRAAYIGRRTETGHTSIIEHSNVVFYVPVGLTDILDLAEFLSNVRYANTVIALSESYDYAYMLIGGTWRAYSDIYLRFSEDGIKTNKVLMKITNLIYQYIPSDGMRDIINLGLLDKSQFADNPSGEIINAYSCCKNNRLDEDINIVNMDSVSALIDAITVACPEPYLFTYKDLMSLLSVTIEFNNMSRIITQQLTRHRNGITQESQRYVDYSGARFNSPAKFKPDKYDDKTFYTVKFGGVQVRMNLQTIGDNICAIYKQLADKMTNPGRSLMKEDARGYLPNNTQCGKIYMTFTYYSLIKFLQLREDTHAQAEIRGYALRIGEWFRSMLEKESSVFCNDIYEVLKPTSADTPFSVPIVGSKESDEDKVTENMTAEEYATLASISIEKQDEQGKPEEENT